MALRVLDEIREQPEILRRVLDGTAALVEEEVRSRRPARLHFVGCGDMHFSAQLVEVLARDQWGLEVRAWRSMDLRWVHHRLGAEDLVVCASVSGRTRRTLEAARLAREAGAGVLGVTDNPGSALDEAVEACVILGTAPPEELLRNDYAGYRNVLPQTVSFTAVLSVELLLAAMVAGDAAPVFALPELFADLVPFLEPQAAALAPGFYSGGEELVVLGSGPHFPMARYGAAKNLEYAIPAIAQCLEEYNHLEIFVGDSATRALLLAGDDPSRARAAELTGAWERFGVRSLVLAGGGSFPGDGTRLLRLPERDLLESVMAEGIALQLLAVHGASALGRDTDQWLGGRRTDLVQEMSQETIRGSEIWRPPSQ
jgi:glucosamine--fructose-6-phosphate aminotransferase (isomerizing)